jgi:hypothetical protein
MSTSTTPVSATQRRVRRTIMFFVALNVVAIGTVMSVYGSMKPAA